jgi:SAM-dependent methyltransferase
MDELPGCPACADGRRRPRYRKFGLDLVQCQGCGLVYANPRLSPEEIWRRYNPDYFWNEYLPALGVNGGKYDLEIFDARHAAMLRLIEKQVPRRGRLLEIGAAAGFFLKAAERAGWDAAGIELSAEAVKFARGELKLDVRQETAENLTFPPASFDAAVMFDVIEHLLDPLLVLRHVRAALKPGAILVVSTPNFNALTRFALGLDWAVLSPAEHLFNFSARSLELALRRAGFSPVILERRYEGFGVFETMNPRYTHAPNALRTKVYDMLVSKLGWAVYRNVQRLGLADTLVALAFRPRDDSAARESH